MNVIHVAVTSELIETIMKQGTIPEHTHTNPLPHDAELIYVEHTPFSRCTHLYFKTNTNNGIYLPEGGNIRGVEITEMKTERKQ